MVGSLLEQCYRHVLPGCKGEAELRKKPCEGAVRKYKIMENMGAW